MTKDLKKILYVEDEEDIALVVTMTLEELSDFDVLHCSSGQEALDVFAHFDPQLVILDVMMPRLDGPATLARLRDLPGGDAVPVIFMTAKAQAYERERYHNLGAIGIIPKPFDPMTLVGSIYALWEDRSADRLAS